MIRNITRDIYYFFYDILIFLNNLKSTQNFLLLLPRFISLILKKVFIYDKKNKKIFIQKIRNRYDLLTIYEIFSEESYNLTKFECWKEVYKNYLQIIDNKKKPLLIDCGSNIGSSTEYFNRIFKNIFSIMIEANTESAIFSGENIYNKDHIILNKAISSKKKTVMIDNTNEDNRASKISSLFGKKIDTITVPELLTKYQNKTPFIIKIDIEGYEKDLFESNFDWIKEFQIIVIEIHDWMLPFHSVSRNFFKAIYEKILIDDNRDFIISGENLIIIKK